jgi:adenine/guanine phosphoribosyltransferase-like PRPP-binding protein
MKIGLHDLYKIIHEVMVGQNTYNVTMSDFYAVARQQGKGKSYLSKATGGGVFAPYFIGGSFDPKRSNTLAVMMSRHGGKPFDVMTAIKKGSVVLDSGLKIVAGQEVQQQVVSIIARGIAEGAKKSRVDAVACADSRSPMAQELAQRVSAILNVPFIKDAFKKTNDPTSLKIDEEMFDAYANRHRNEPEKIARMRKYLESELKTLKNKAQKSEYISIADHGEIKHREYFKGFHLPQAEEVLDMKRLLIIDDNIDKGATMRDLASIAKSLGIEPIMAAGFRINREP